MFIFIFQKFNFVNKDEILDLSALFFHAKRCYVNSLKACDNSS